jgi:hypothetical protein
MKDRRVVFMTRMQVVYLQGEKFPFLCLGSGGLCALIAAAFFLLHCTALHIVACKKRLGHVAATNWSICHTCRPVVVSWSSQHVLDLISMPHKARVGECEWLVVGDARQRDTETLGCNWSAGPYTHAYNLFLEINEIHQSKSLFFSCITLISPF